MANGYGAPNGTRIMIAVVFYGSSSFLVPRSPFPISHSSWNRKATTADYTDSLTNSIELQALSRGLVFHSCQHTPFCHPAPHECTHACVYIRTYVCIYADRFHIFIVLSISVSGIVQWPAECICQTRKHRIRCATTWVRVNNVVYPPPHTLRMRNIDFLNFETPSANTRLMAQNPHSKKKSYVARNAAEEFVCPGVIKSPLWATGMERDNVKSNSSKIPKRGRWKKMNT